MAEQKKIRWGIISTGYIAGKFMQALLTVKEAVAVAVASRSIESANSFGDKFNIERRYGSYEELAKDPNIDIVFIGTPHNFHKDNAILCLNNNKSVLVEKAFTLNAKEAREVIELARAKNLFVMEAMWTRFFPGTQKVKEMVANKEIGEVQYVAGDLSFNTTLTGKADPNGRFYNPDLAGGALLDVGIYAMSYASYILDAQPTSFDTTVFKTEKGVDERFSIYAKYPNGVTGFLGGSLQSVSPRQFQIVGSHGYITIPLFSAPKKIIFKIKDQPEQTLDFSWPAEYGMNGMGYEALAVTKYMIEGKKQSDIMTPEETIRILETLDSIRAKWGLKYPGELYFGN